MPLHVPVTLPIWLPAAGVNVNDVVAPLLTVCCVDGDIEPLPVSLGVTVKVIGVKFAITVQLVVIALVVKMLPDSVPPHVPLTFPILLPAAGVSVNVAVAPLFIVCGLDGEMAPLPVMLGVTMSAPTVNVALASASAAALLLAMVPV